MSATKANPELSHLRDSPIGLICKLKPPKHRHKKKHRTSNSVSRLLDWLRIQPQGETSFDFGSLLRIGFLLVHCMQHYISAVQAMRTTVSRSMHTLGVDWRIHTATVDDPIQIYSYQALILQAIVR